MYSWNVFIFFVAFFTFSFKSVAIFDKKERKAKKKIQTKKLMTVKDQRHFVNFVTLYYFCFLELFFLSLCTFSLFFAHSFCSKFVHAHKIKRAIYFIVVCINFTVNACKASSVRSIFSSKLLYHCLIGLKGFLSAISFVQKLRCWHQNDCDEFFFRSSFLKLTI